MFVAFLGHVKNMMDWLIWCGCRRWLCWLSAWGMTWWQTTVNVAFCGCSSADTYRTLVKPV